MAGKLHFSLVSPERELYAGEVDQVDIPGTEGNFGVLPDHAPLMAAIRTGAITVYENGAEKQFFVQGGFADVTPAGLTVLAERAAPMSELTSERIQEDIATAKDALVGLQGEDALAVQQNLDGLNAVAATL